MLKGTVTFIVAFILGLGGHIVYLATQPSEITLSTEQEDAFLKRYSCNSTILNQLEVKIIRQAFQNRGSDEDQVIIEPLKNGCAFRYSVGEDSYLLGKGVVIRDENYKIKNVDFLSRLDPGVAEYDRPTFSLVFYGKNSPEFVLNTFDNSLYRVSGDVLLLIPAE